MKKIIALVLALSFFVVSGSLVSAQKVIEFKGPPDVQPTATKVIEFKGTPIQQPGVISDIKGDLKQIRAEYQNKIQTERQNAVQLIETKRVETNKILEQKRQEFQNQIKQERDVFKQQIEKNREALMLKIKNFKDEKKKTVAERVDLRLEEINKIQTDHFVAVLDQIEKVLGSIEIQADKMQANGQDVSKVRTAIDSAAKAIADARTAVVVQSKKTYTPTITSETTVQADLKKARESLNSDLKAVREVIKKSHEAVVSSLHELRNVKPLPSATPSPIPSATTSPTPVVQ